MQYKVQNDAGSSINPAVAIAQFTDAIIRKDANYRLLDGQVGVIGDGVLPQQLCHFLRQVGVNYEVGNSLSQQFVAESDILFLINSDAHAIEASIPRLKENVFIFCCDQHGAEVEYPYFSAWQPAMTQGNICQYQVQGEQSKNVNLIRFEPLELKESKLKATIAGDTDLIFASKYFDSLVAQLESQLRDLEPSFILVCHIVPTIIPYLNAIKQLGKIKAIIPKGEYGKRLSYIEAWVKEHYSNEYKETIYECKDIRGALNDSEVAKRFLKDHIGEGERGVIIDIGAYFAPALPAISQDHELCKRLVGIVEDTENGEQKYASLEVLNHSAVPIYSVARSVLKRGEDFNVGMAIVQSTETVLLQNGRSVQSLTVGVIGFGKIGHGIVSQLQLLACAKLLLCEIDPDRERIAHHIGYELVRKETVMQQCDVIICATGVKSLRGTEFGQLKDGVTISSCTSSDSEFDLAWLKQQPHKVKGDIVEYQVMGDQNKTKSVQLVHNGNAVNFLHGGVVGPNIYGVQGGLLKCAVNLVAAEDSVRANFINRLRYSEEAEIGEVFTAHFSGKDCLYEEYSVKQPLEEFYGNYGLLEVCNNFVNREKPMAELKRDVSQAIVTGKPVAVVGMRGVGKTSLLQGFAAWSLECEMFGRVIRLDAGTGERHSSFQLLMHHITTIARKLGISVKSKEATELTAEVYSKLHKRYGRILVIIENVIDISLLNIFKPASKYAVCVFSSINLNESWPGCAVVKLGVFEFDEAVCLVRRSLGAGFGCVANFDELIHEHGRHPLSLHLACAQIKQTGDSISQYLARFKQSRARYLADCHASKEDAYVSEKLIRSDEEAYLRASVYAAVLTSLDCLRQERSVVILKVSSYLASGERISKRFFMPWTQANFDDCQSAIHELARYGLVSCDDASVCVHKVVQDCLRISVNEPIEAWHEVADVICVYLEQDDDLLLQEIRDREMVPHIQQVLDWYDELQIETRSKDLARCKVQYAKLLWYQANCLGSIGRVIEARKAISIAAEIYAEYKKDTLDLLRLQNSQILYEDRCGNSKRAVELAERLLNEQMLLLQFEPKLLAATQLKLAQAYMALEKSEKAMPIFKQLLSYYNEHPCHLLVNINQALGVACLEQKNVADAWCYFCRAEEFAAYYFHSGHESVAIALVSQVKCYLDDNTIMEYGNAIATCEYALELQRATIGEQHSEVADTYYTLATLLALDSKYKYDHNWQNQILEYARQAEQIFRLSLPESHIYCARANRYIAIILHLRKDYSEALKYYKKALLGYEGFYGRGSPAAVQLIMNIRKLEQRLYGQRRMMLVSPTYYANEVRRRLPLGYEPVCLLRGDGSVQRF